MGISTQRVKLDIGKQASMQVIRLGQGDRNGTTLIAELYDGGSPYSLSGKTARFTMRTPDGRSSYSVASSSISNNTATFNLDERYAAGVAGTTDTAYVEVLSGSTVICSTSRMRVICLQSAIEGVSPSQMHDNGLDAAIAAANAATAEVREAMSDISELAVPLMSADTRGGAKLGSGLTLTDGALSVDGSTIQLPTMTASVSGGAKLGSGLDVSDGALSVSPIPDASIDSVASGDSQTGAQSLSLTGLSRLWAKMRAAFAAMSHVHSADDVTTGTLPVARGGTGATTAAEARTALGAAPASHVHSADDVTTGTLPVSRGGTGLAASPSALVDLASSAASSMMQASPRPGVTGTLPVAHGGTGLAASPSALVDLASSAASSMMQASPRPGVTGTLPVAHGGTGGTTPADARTALGLGIYASLTNQSSSLTLTTSAQKVPLHGEFAQYGGCTEYENGIKVPVAGVYLITGLAYFTTGFTANDMIHAELRKNGSSLGDSLCRVYLANAYQSFAAPTRIVSLAANDIITLHAWNQTAARGTVENRNGHGITLVKIA